VGKYAIGGAAVISASSEKPVVAVESNQLSLTALARTNDAKLAVVGEAVTSLANYMNAPSITTVNDSDAGVGQAGAPAGCEKQAFTTAQDGARKFLRLIATLAP